MVAVGAHANGGPATPIMPGAAEKGKRYVTLLEQGLTPEEELSIHLGRGWHIFDPATEILRLDARAITDLSDIRRGDTLQAQIRSDIAGGKCIKSCIMNSSGSS